MMPSELLSTKSLVTGKKSRAHHFVVFVMSKLKKGRCRKILNK